MDIFTDGEAQIFIVLESRNANKFHCIREMRTWNIIKETDISDSCKYFTNIAMFERNKINICKLLFLYVADTVLLNLKNSTLKCSSAFDWEEYNIYEYYIVYYASDNKYIHEKNIKPVNISIICYCIKNANIIIFASSRFHCNQELYVWKWKYKTNYQFTSNISYLQSKSIFFFIVWL